MLNLMEKAQLNAAAVTVAICSIWLKVLVKCQFSQECGLFNKEVAPLKTEYTCVNNSLVHVNFLDLPTANGKGRSHRFTFWNANFTKFSDELKMEFGYSDVNKHSREYAEFHFGYLRQPNFFMSLPYRNSSYNSYRYFQVTQLVFTHVKNLNTTFLNRFLNINYFTALHFKNLSFDVDVSRTSSFLDLSNLKDQHLFSLKLEDSPNVLTTLPPMVSINVYCSRGQNFGLHRKSGLTVFNIEVESSFLDIRWCGGDSSEVYRFIWNPKIVHNQTYWIPRFILISRSYYRLASVYIYPSDKGDPKKLSWDTFAYAREMDIGCFPDTIEEIEHLALGRNNYTVDDREERALLVFRKIGKTKPDTSRNYDEDFEPSCEGLVDLDNRNDSTFEWWVVGECAKYYKEFNSLFVCEVCFMHQFGLHRVRDNVKELCENGERLGQEKVIKCRPDRSSPQIPQNRLYEFYEYSLNTYPVTRICQSGTTKTWTTSTKTTTPPPSHEHDTGSVLFVLALITLFTVCLAAVSVAVSRHNESQIPPDGFR